MGEVFSAIGDWLEKDRDQPRLEGGHTTGPPRKPGPARRIRDFAADVDDAFETNVVEPLQTAWDESKLGQWIETFPEQDEWLKLKALMR